MKVCIKKITCAKTQGLQKEARITKEGLQIRKDNKGKMNEEFLKLVNIGGIAKYSYKVQKLPSKDVLKKAFLKVAQNLHENLFARISLSTKLSEWVLNSIKKILRSQVFSFEPYVIFMNTYFVEHLWRVASEYEWRTDLSIIYALELWVTALWSISICMWRVLQNSEIYLKNNVALYKIFKVCPTTIKKLKVK